MEPSKTQLALLRLRGYEELIQGDNFRFFKHDGRLIVWSGRKQRFYENLKDLNRPQQNLIDTLNNL